MKDTSELKPKPARMNLTPMIDVVFLLIIFFVVSNTMMQRDLSMQLDLPAAAGGESDTESATGKIIVNIDAAGNLFFGTAPVTRDELLAALLKEKTNAARPLEVRIRTDRSVRYEKIEPVLILCVEAGITDVAFSVVDSEEK